jgi:hypothetical protein
MRQLVWILLLAIAAGLVYWFIHLRRRWAERERASEERFAAFMAKTLPQRNGAPPSLAPVAPPATPKPAAPVQPAAPASAPRSDPAASHQQLLLLEAAAKAAEAGEPALAIQLYARLLGRYPDSALGAQARAAIEEQKKKLSKG